MGRKMCSIRTSYMDALICMHFICMLSCVQFFEILWSVAHQTPMFMGFFRQEYWSGLSFPPLGYLPDPGIKLTSHACPILAGIFFTTDHLGNPFSSVQSLSCVQCFATPCTAACQASLATPTLRVYSNSCPLSW